MPPKRKAAASAAGSSTSRCSTTKTSARKAPVRKVPKLAAQLDMYIRRSDDEDESDSKDAHASYGLKQKQQRLIARAHEPEYEPESDEASHVSSEHAASDEDTDVQLHDKTKLKTVSAANLGFLSGLDNNKALDVSQKLAKHKAKLLKRSDRRQFEEQRKRIIAENKASLTQPWSDDDDDDDDDSHDFSDAEQQIRSRPTHAEKKNFQEYSDVSEGDEVDALSDQDAGVLETSRNSTGNRAGAERQDAEAAYLARLDKRNAREQYQAELERQKRLNAKLPIRKLERPVSQNDADSSDDDIDLDHLDQGQGEQHEDRQDSEAEQLDSWIDDDDHDHNDDNACASKRAVSSRAVHAPLPRSADSDSDEEPAAATSTPVTLSSITHSSRFNLTAPYEIVLTSHACRLPAPPRAVGSNRKAVLESYRTALLGAQKQTLVLARNQIASLASQIVADPEVNLGLLRRLAVFAAPTISAPPEKIAEIRLEQAEAKAKRAPHTARPIKIDVPVSVRQLAMLSMLAVFVDILPAYRIRSLTDKEKEEKVGQDVARRREFESGLVQVYKQFLQLCEVEVKVSSTTTHDGKRRVSPASSPALEKAAIKVFTTLATRAVHFNFRTNILGVVVARMSRRTWGELEESCYQAISCVVLSDLNGEVALEVVRLIHRMTKERRYKVNSRVLDILLHLRLRDELGKKRSSTTTTTDPDAEAARERQVYAERRAAMKAREAKKSGKGGGKASTSKDVRKGLATHVSKKQLKKQKQLKQIEQEMKEAEATVDLQERERNQTETLKLVFVLYFSVLKRDVGQVGLRVLESTLKGLSMYAHRVNVDFFRDLLDVLKKHIAVNAALLEEPGEHTEMDGDASDSDSQAQADNVLLDQTTLSRSIRHMVLALKTTFDLFLGQAEGSMLNLDLTDVLGHFYYTLFYLPFVNEAHVSVSSGSRSDSSIVDLALDSLYSILIGSRTRFHPQLLAAFAKRLAIISLHLGASGAGKVVRLIAQLVTKPSTSASATQLALLDLEDRSRNGSYQALGNNLATTAVLESGQTILWELCHLTKLRNPDLSHHAHQVWALSQHSQ